MSSSWLQELKSRTQPLWSRPSARRAPRSRNARRRPRVEQLEDRTLLSTFTVTTTADSGPGSLRQAILDANAANTGTAANPDLIQFAIPTNDPNYQSATSSWTIAPASLLPNITDSTVLDATTQPGFTGTPIIVLDGSNSGLTVAGNGGSTIRGLVIDNSSSDGILLLSGGNTIADNWIGIDVTGTAAKSNARTGIEIESSNNTIGGATTAVPPSQADVQLPLIDGSASKIDLGTFAGGQVLSISATGQGDLVDSRWQVLPDGSLAAPAQGVYAFANAGTAYATAFGGDGTNQFPGGGANYDSTGSGFGFAGKQTTDTTDPGAIRLGAIVGTFAANPTRSDWFLIGVGTTVIIPLGGAHLYVAVNDSASSDNHGAYTVNVADLSSSAGNWIAGNSGSGLLLAGNGTNTAIEGNTIVYNAGAGIHSINQPNDGTTILSNSIFGNAQSGISLDNANSDQIAPVLTAVSISNGSATISGTLTSTPNTTFLIQFFGNPVAANPLGLSGTPLVSSTEGVTLLGSITVTTDASGNASFTAAGLPMPAGEDDPSATATVEVTTGNTPTYGDTSPFSQNLYYGRPFFTVTTTATYSTVTDYGYDSNPVPGSLHQAILFADSIHITSTPTYIAFDIPTSDPGYDSSTGAFTINDYDGLADVTAPVTIDGYTQPGARANQLALGDNAVLKIVLIGQGDWYINADDSTLRGLNVQSTLHGLGVRSFRIFFNGTGDVFEGNFLGTNVPGTTALDANGQPYAAFVGLGGAQNTVGGPTPDARNIVAPDSLGIGGTDNVAENNYIGTDISGEHSLWPSTGIGGYGAVGVNLGGSDNTVGGTAAGTGNVISGNDTGILMYAADASGFVIEGNLIGLDATGQRALGNSGSDILGWDGGSSGTIGGTTSGARNIIAAVDAGIVLGGPSSIQIEGNWIGTDIGGQPVSRAEGAVIASGGVTIGGLTSTPGTGAGNIIGSADNESIDDLLLSGSGNVVEGNVVGAVALNSSSGNTIGGVDPGARNIILGGVLFSPLPTLPSQDFNTNDVVEGNWIGTDLYGNPVAGGGIVLYDATGTTIANNRISSGPAIAVGMYWDPYVPSPVPVVNTTIEGNTIIDLAGYSVGFGLPPYGIILENASQTRILGNSISGYTNNLTAFPGNTPGAAIAVNGATATTIGGNTSGAGNSLSANDEGVAVLQGMGTTILGNAIFGNNRTGIGITNPGTDQVAPVLTSATGSLASPVVNGTLAGIASTTYRVEVFASPAPGSPSNTEGETYLGSTYVTIDASGDPGTFQATTLGAIPSGEDYLSATATVASSTDPNTATFGNTSPFSSYLLVVPTTANVTSSVNPSYFGQPVAFTANVQAAPGAPPGSVDLVDTTTGVDFGTVPLTNGGASVTTSSLAVGPNAISAVYSGQTTAGNPYTVSFLPSSGSLTQNVYPTIVVLNPTVPGALSVSGTAMITIPGLVFVDSSSKSALSEKGSAQINAVSIQVVGGVHTDGSAGFSVPPTTGVLALPDPLAGLVPPSPTGMTNYGSVSMKDGSRVLSPGIYLSIRLSGTASVTLNPGVYVIEGGGLTVTGGASISGQGVLIYNAGSNYPNAGGSFGGITLSGSGTMNLTAATTGPYAGVVIFQSRQNTRALSLSGSSVAGITGAIYAANALLTLSGSASLQAPLVVGTLNVSGGVSLTETAAGGDGSGDVPGIGNTLLAGDLYLYVNDPGGYFSADELARIQDAINGWDAVLAPYNVTITEVSDPTAANLVLDAAITSACGGMDAGVLGCFNADAGEITMIEGWDWYAGPDPTQAGPSQYDFQTVVTHELGHALGLGGSADPGSPMNETLPAATVRRTPAVADLNLTDPPEGADPEMAAPPTIKVPPPSALPGPTAAVSPRAAPHGIDFESFFLSPTAGAAEPIVAARWQTPSLVSPAALTSGLPEGGWSSGGPLAANPLAPSRSQPAGALGRTVDAWPLGDPDRDLQDGGSVSVVELSSLWSPPPSAPCDPPPPLLGELPHDSPLDRARPSAKAIDTNMDFPAGATRYGLDGLALGLALILTGAANPAAETGAEKRRPGVGWRSK